MRNRPRAMPDPHRARGLTISLPVVNPRKLCRLPIGRFPTCPIGSKRWRSGRRQFLIPEYTEYDRFRGGEYAAHRPVGPFLKPSGNCFWPRASRPLLLAGRIRECFVSWDGSRTGDSSRRDQWTELQVRRAGYRPRICRRACGTSSAPPLHGCSGSRVLWRIRWLRSSVLWRTTRSSCGSELHSIGGDQPDLRSAASQSGCS